jgi:predicted O-methyltransferase YrrM
VLEWRNDTSLVVDGTEFALAPTDVDHGVRAATDAGALLLRKGRWMVERYAALTDGSSPANIVELGIYEGGSTALLALLYRPRRLVAFDLKPTRVAALDRFIDAKNLTGSVHPYYGVNQADRPRLESILADEFGSEPLDLVIDDASHLFDETTASFNVLFPRLRAGGLFVIEDWSSRHAIERVITERLRSDEQAHAELVGRLESGEVTAPSDDPLSRLVLELVLTAAYDERIVAEVMNVRQGWLVVQRGDAALDPGTFDIASCYGSLGTQLLRSPRTDS